MSENFVAEVAENAKHLGVDPSEYTRQALEAFNERVMGQRIAGIARALRAETDAAAADMDDTVADGLAGT
ncbi:MAG: hypothetical protein Q8M37_02155 [Nevskia sp.]|nr:hypothetical protein [Nevskia sp.]